jgi:hypothetical protein
VLVIHQLNTNQRTIQPVGCIGSTALFEVIGARERVEECNQATARDDDFLLVFVLGNRQDLLDASTDSLLRLKSMPYHLEYILHSCCAVSLERERERDTDHIPMAGLGSIGVQLQIHRD